MLASEYMSDVMRFNNLEIDIGPVALSILEHFVDKPEFSTYQIYKALKTTIFKLEYKNVHKRIQRLIELNFIRKVDKEKSKRNAIYYRLTSEGFFYFLRKERQSIIKGQQIFENYGSDKSFQALLYPYIDSSTIVKMNSLEFYVEVLLHMKQCCEEIYNRLYSIKQGNLDYDTPVYTNLGTEDGYDKLIKFLEIKMKLTPVLPKIQTVEGSLVVGYPGTKVIFTYLGDDKIKVSIKKRNLTKNSITNQQFRLLDLGFNLNRVNNTRPMSQVLGESLNYSIVQKFVVNLVSSIIKRGVNIERYDLSILAGDKKFMTFLDEVYQDFRCTHDKLMTLRMS